MKVIKHTGCMLIAKERMRQIEKEGWTAKHDDEHRNGELALAAAVYATPILLYKKEEYAKGFEFMDAWPFEESWDKRPELNRPQDRIRLLAMAGALIAAEIDRLQRKR